MATEYRHRKVYVMRKSYAQSNLEIADYVEQTFVPEDTVLISARERAKAEGLPEIQVCSMDALHLEMLVRISGAKKLVEVGTLAGYSGIALMRGAGSGGKLVTLEKDPQCVTVARENFKAAGLSECVEVIEGDALSSLDRIAPDGPFDLVFIDADKGNYANYFDWATKNLKKGGMIIGDNCFAFGTIHQKKFDHPNSKKVAEQLDAFNVAVARHPDFRATMLPTGEGMLVGMKVD